MTGASNHACCCSKIISQRHDRGSNITTNCVYRESPEIFNNDATVTSAVLDRLLRHVVTVVMEGRSFRTKKDANPEL